jgi:uncharacterized membrane protein
MAFNLQLRGQWTLLVSWMCFDADIDVSGRGADEQQIVKVELSFEGLGPRINAPLSSFGIAYRWFVA